MRSLIIFALTTCCCLHIAAEPDKFYPYGLKHLTHEHGLASNTMLEIYQDKTGFLWLGTDMGISRYDGIHFHNYNLTEKNPRAIKRIFEIEQDSLLWLKQNKRNEIACFDKKTGIYLSLKSSNAQLLNDITDLCVINQHLYAITSNGIARLDYQRRGNEIMITPTTIIEHHCKLTQIQGENIHIYALDENNNIVILNLVNRDKSILNYNRLQTQKEIVRFKLLNEHIWITTNYNGTYCYHPKTDELRIFGEENNQLRGLTVDDLCMVNDSVFIAATPHSILRIAFEGNNYIHSSIHVNEMSFDNYMYSSFIKNRITKLHVDRQNSIIWLGTFGKGLLSSQMEDDEIHRILLNSEIKDVNGLAQDTNGHIWLATKHNGVWRSVDNKLSPNMEFKQWENATPNSYSCIFKDMKGNLWIGGEDGNVQCLTPQCDQITIFTPKDENNNSVGNILHIYPLYNSMYLVTTKGLFLYNYVDNYCIASFTYNETVSKITSLCEDGDGQMWLGTNHGVKRVEIKEGKIALSDYDEYTNSSINEVLALYVNRHNQLCISYDDKIVQINSSRKGIEGIKNMHKEDIMSGHAECFIDDRNGNTWLGTNHGIMTIDNTTKISYTYTFPERFFNVCQLEDGQLLWSNSIGLMSFDPQELKRSNIAQKLYISDLGINYKLVEIGEEINGQTILNKPIYQLDELELNHANNSMVFYLTNFNYSSTSGKLEYRLLPTQKDWITSSRSEIEFSNLSAGDYKLEVRPITINDEEVPLTTLNIRVKKHWANTFWAYLGYLLMATMFIGLTTFYLRAKAARRQFHRKKEELLKNTLAEEIKNRKEEGAQYQLKNQIRYGIAREMHTPLSLVTAPLKEIVGDQNLSLTLKSKAQLAYKNALCIQNVCNLMGNIYELESEDLSLNVGSYTITELMNNAISSSNELLHSVPILLHYDKNKYIKKELWVDRKKTEYIFRNMLTNAYRHISYSGNVYVNTFAEKDDEKTYFCFQIKDEGKEIIEKSGIYLLNKEGNENELDTQLHSELGILLMREYIIAHHGYIRIEQDKESGTCVTAYIPLGKDHFEGDAQVKFIEEEEEEEEIFTIKSVSDITTAEEKEQEDTENEVIAPSTPAPSTKHKILVIEDHKDIRLYLKVLFSANYNVIMAENGEEGLRLARKEMPDIILSDVMMPEMNGFECTRALKEDMKTCHIPIILLTALAGDSNATKGIDLGADDYILKPFNPDVLRSKVKRLIKNRMDLKQAYMKLMMNSKTDENEQENDGPKEDPFIRQIFDIVEGNLQNPDFNVKRLAEMLNMSQPTLYRRVKMLTNYTIIELIRGVRLKRASELLKSKKYSVQEVSEMVGYNDAPTFRKHFVDFYGTTPSAFANKEETEEKIAE